MVYQRFFMKHRFLKISWKTHVGEPFGHEIRWFFFAGANFIALRRRACSYTWLVERYACRVIQALGHFCGRMPAMASVVFGHISSDLSKRAHSFGLWIFFTTGIRSGGAMDRWNVAHELLAKELWWTNGFSWNIDFFKILWKINVCKQFGHEIRWFFFAGANFIALRRHACSYTWLIERYACRVIPALGDFCERMSVMESVVFGHISSNFSNRARSHCDPAFFPTRICSGGAINRWDKAFELVAKAWWCTNGFSWNIDFWKFHEKLTLVNRLGMKFGDFSSLARISLLCGAALVHIHDS